MKIREKTRQAVLWMQQALRYAERSDRGLRGSEPPNRGLAVFVAFVAAFLLWFTVSMRGTYPVTVQLSTQVVNIPEGRALEALPPSFVRVQVQGEGWHLLRLYTTREVISINAAVPKFNLTEAVVLELPRELDVQSVSPPECDVRLGEQTRRKIPIRFRGNIRPALTHDTTQTIRLHPDSVYVEGATSVVRGLRYWPTERFERQNIRGMFTAKIELADTLEGLVTLSQTATTLYADIEQFTEIVREVAVRVTELPEGNRGVSLIPDRVDVVFRVPLSQALEAERTDDLYAFVPYSDIVLDSLGSVEPRLQQPPGFAIRNVAINPARLRYYLVVD